MPSGQSENMTSVSASVQTEMLSSVHQGYPCREITQVLKEDLGVCRGVVRICKVELKWF